MSRKYKFHNVKGLYFVSFAIVYWIDLFTREEYLKILAQSIDYCRKHKGLELYAYCFMPSHVHLIFRDQKENPSKLLQEFKRHTAKKILQAVENNPQESRKEWLLWMFEKAGKSKANVSKYQVWQHHNKPIELWSLSVIKQKIDYIHQNPVNAGFVVHPEDWKYSSAKNFQEDHTILEIDEIGFLA